MSLKVSKIVLLCSFICVSICCTIQTTQCNSNNDCTPFQICLSLNSTCVGGPYVGDNCTENAECLLGYCITNGLCYDIPLNSPAPCNQQSDCRQGNCSIALGNGICGLTGKSCRRDTDCLPCDVCSLGVCIIQNKEDEIYQ